MMRLVDTGLAGRWSVDAGENHLFVEGHAQFVNGIHENANIFRVGLGNDAMSEIENVAGPGAIGIQNLSHLGPDCLG